MAFLFKASHACMTLCDIFSLALWCCTSHHFSCFFSSFAFFCPCFDLAFKMLSYVAKTSLFNLPIFPEVSCSCLFCSHSLKMRYLIHIAEMLENEICTVAAFHVISAFSHVYFLSIHVLKGQNSELTGPCSRSGTVLCTCCPFRLW